MDDCIFCKISAKETPTDLVYEDKDMVVIKDINPKAPVHLLIIPRKHIASLQHIQSEDVPLLGRLLLRAKKLADEQQYGGYKLLINVGKDAGQIVEHLHVHVLAGGKPSELP